MGMTPMYNPHDLSQKNAAALRQRLETALAFILNDLGMELVTYARQHRTYTDRTGNLTNSMGYVVVKGGTIAAHGGELGGGEGQEAAFKLYSELAPQTGYDYCLIIVAGMNYAAYVESKGYNVLLPAQLKADLEFMSRMKKLMEKYDAKLKALLRS